jgi:hypothetical protein
MNAIVCARAGPELLQRWRCQVASQRRRNACALRQDAALGYLAQGPIYHGLIDVRRLVFVVLHDQQRPNNALAMRVSGYVASGVPWGVKIGGSDHNRFEKDLMCAPARRARGQRFDLAQSELLGLALQLDRYLDRQARHCRKPRLHHPRWPQPWAAFEPAIAAHFRGAGPEFETRRDACTRPADRFRSVQRTVIGLTAFPLEWVSHEWQRITTVFADMQSMPKRQIFTLDHAHRNLCGFGGAVEYDLLNSRFRPTASCRSVDGKLHR